METARIPRRLLMVAPILAAAGCVTSTVDSSSGPAIENPTQGSTTPTRTPTPGWVMPAEEAPHARTWMAFAASEDIWGADLLPLVRSNLADIANTISAFEPVTMLVRPEDQDTARTLLNPAVTLQPLDVDDLWVRDTGPVFVVKGSSLAGVGFNFNGWGGKQEHANDAKVAAAVTAKANTDLLDTKLTLEGGALEVDGAGTAIITESCVLNPNRNPGWTKDQVEAELAALLGIRKVIWLPGIAGKDITDGHTDFYARFVARGHVVAALDDDPDSFDYDVTRAHLDILQSATDAGGAPLTVTTLTAPATLRAPDPGPDFAAGYINFYVCNGAVIAPQFGDPHADQAAHDTLSKLFPTRTIKHVAIDGIAAGGGGIHCATQQQPNH